MTKPSKYIFLLLLFIHPGLSAQEKATVFGNISDDKSQPLELVNIAIQDMPGGSITNRYGDFSIQIPADTPIVLVISFIGFEKQYIRFHLRAGEKREIKKALKATATNLPDITITDKRLRRTTLTPIDPKTVKVIPSVSGGIEAIIKTLPGVSSASELSSQYSVRGGNFDENLVYVNDIEIYRPFLIRSGQQEGLSFLNPDLTSSILFSAGGFEAKYGDKLSSVLDIRYKKPTRFGGSVSLSLLGGAFHIEGVAAKKKLSYLLGIRQKSNQYLLKGLQTEGDYRPSFTDIQGYLAYRVNPKLELSFLGNYSRNLYQLIPSTRETDFGTINQAYRFTVYFEGQEVDKFINYLGALTATYRPEKNITLKFITSAYRTKESETYDILGQYYISRLETDYGKDQFGTPLEPIGVGSFLEHARNYLYATVFNAEHKGSMEKGTSYLNWGIKYQFESIDDELREWQLLDSAGYSLPHPPDKLGDSSITPMLYLNEFVAKEISLQSNRLAGYIQNTWTLPLKKSTASLTAGIRGNYWDFNSQFLLSPRVSVSIKPQWEKDFLFRFATGYYHQPPFYRELRNEQGDLNYNIKAQTSIHFVAAMDYNFVAWSRPFKIVTEVYYKILENLIPYEIDNVRIRYLSDEISNGYATGIDFRVNGEFVRGIESWISISIMQTQEDIVGDYYYDENGIRIEPGYIPRPTDQRINFSLFFQDYLPKNPTFKMHLNLMFGSSLPFGAPNSPKYTHTLRMPPYRRVDIGFSKQLRQEGAGGKPGSFFRHFGNIWVTLEVFNLLQVDNTISYIWISDINNRQYAIPNYLTPRMLNVKLVVQF